MVNVTPNYEQSPARYRIAAARRGPLRAVCARRRRVSGHCAAGRSDRYCGRSPLDVYYRIETALRPQVKAGGHEIGLTATTGPRSTEVARRLADVRRVDVPGENFGLGAIETREFSPLNGNLNLAKCRS